jgi:hypothetical protein
MSTWLTISNEGITEVLENENADLRFFDVFSGKAKKIIWYQLQEFCASPLASLPSGFLFQLSKGTS